MLLGSGAGEYSSCSVISDPGFNDLQEVFWNPLHLSTNRQLTLSLQFWKKQGKPCHSSEELTLEQITGLPGRILETPFIRAMCVSVSEDVFRAYIDQRH